MTSSGSWPGAPLGKPSYLFQLPSLVLALLNTLPRQPRFPMASVRPLAELIRALPEMVSLHAAEIAGGLWGLSPGSEVLQGAARLSPQARLSSACPRRPGRRGVLPNSTPIPGLEHLKRPFWQRQVTALCCAGRSAGVALESVG